MIILQLTFSLSSGGAERFVVDLCNELARLGHEVHLVVLREKMKNKNDANFYKFLLHENVIFHSLNVNGGIRLSAFTKTSSIIRRINPDIVHCHLNVIPYIFPLALYNKRISFFHTLHSLAEKAVGFRFQKGINRYYYRTNKIRPITISQICNHSYKEFYKLNNTITIDNGRSTVEATKDIDVTKLEIENYINSENSPVFIHVARFSNLKNQGLLINVFNRIASEGINFTLLVIGSSFDTEEGKRLQENACPSIKFLGAKQNVNDYFLCADAFCLTSIYEGLPISLLEALSAGCVPICTPVGGIPDVIKDGFTGYLSDDVSEESYYKSVQRFLNNPGAIDEKVLQNHFNRNYSIEKCASEHVSLYINK